MERKTCRGCGADVIFARTEAGRTGIYDPAGPADDGKGYLISEGVAKYHAGEPGTVVHKSHYATCPKSAHFRAKSAAKARRENR